MKLTNNNRPRHPRITKRQSDKLPLASASLTSLQNTISARRLTRRQNRNTNLPRYHRFQILRITNSPFLTSFLHNFHIRHLNPMINIDLSRSTTISRPNLRTNIANLTLPIAKILHRRRIRKHLKTNSSRIHATNARHHFINPIRSLINQRFLRPIKLTRQNNTNT